MDAPELVRLLAGHGMQKPSPCLDLKVPGLQAGKEKMNITNLQYLKHYVNKLQFNQNS